MKSPQDMNDDELHANWEAGMSFDSSVGLSPRENEQLSAIEKEMTRRDGLARNNT